MWGEGLVENVIWGGGGWLKTSEYRHMEVESLKLLKNRHVIFECSLILLLIRSYSSILQLIINSEQWCRSMSNIEGVKFAFFLSYFWNEVGPDLGAVHNRRPTKSGKIDPPLVRTGSIPFPTYPSGHTINFEKSEFLYQKVWTSASEENPFVRTGQPFPRLRTSFMDGPLHRHLPQREDIFKRHSFFTLDFWWRSTQLQAIFSYEFLEYWWDAAKFLGTYTIVGSVAERIKAPFLWRPCDHDYVI